jgi:hypothetical protein
MAKDNYKGYSKQKIPTFRDRDNKNLIETQKLYDAPGVLNATFIFYNYKGKKGKKQNVLVNEETGHSKQNSMSHRIKQAMTIAFFSAEAQNRAHGGITGARFILKNWYIIYYKMPMSEHQHKPRFFFSFETDLEYDKKTKKTKEISYTVSNEFNEKTGKYTRKLSQDKRKSDIDTEIEITLEDFNKE